MRLLSPTGNFGVLVRLIAAAAMVAVIAVGAPLHSHDLSVNSGEPGSSPKAPCAACVTGANPGLVAVHADVAPHFLAVDDVSISETVAVSLSLPSRTGRAPPVV